VQLPSVGGGNGEVISIDVHKEMDFPKQVYRAVHKCLGGPGDSFWIENARGQRISNDPSFVRGYFEQGGEFSPLIVAYDTINLLLETMIGTFNIQVGYWDDVAALKSVVARKTGIPSPDQVLHLVSRGDKRRQLDDNLQWLATLGVISGATIKLEVSPDFPALASSLPLHPVLDSLQGHSVCDGAGCVWSLETPSVSSHQHLQQQQKNEHIPTPKKPITIRCRKCLYTLSMARIQSALDDYGLGNFCSWLNENANTLNHRHQRMLHYGTTLLDSLLGEYVLKVEYSAILPKRSLGEAALPTYSELMRYSPPPRKGCCGGQPTSPEVAKRISIWREQCRQFRMEYEPLDTPIAATPLVQSDYNDSESEQQQQQQQQQQSRQQKASQDQTPVKSKVDKNSAGYNHSDATAATPIAKHSDTSGLRREAASVSFSTSSDQGQRKQSTDLVLSDHLKKEKLSTSTTSTSDVPGGNAAAKEALKRATVVAAAAANELAKLHEERARIKKAALALREEPEEGEDESVTQSTIARVEVAAQLLSAQVSRLESSARSHSKEVIVQLKSACII
jgi:hypothetical protein